MSSASGSAGGGSPRSVEFWTTLMSAYGVRTLDDFKNHAHQCDVEEGWDGILIGDAQNYGLDLYVKLTVAAMASQRVQLGSFVTNPVTRHPAVTACAMSSVNALSGGRVVLGIGRGDSALAHIGGAPISVAAFERYLGVVRAYLHGEPVDMDEAASWCNMPSVTTLGLHARPEESRLTWIDPNGPIVPVDVLATGPKVIQAGARLADRVTLALNADVTRLAWGLQLATEARATSELAGTPLSVGAFVLAFVSDDIEWARHQARGMLAATSRFSVMHGDVVGPTSDAHRQVYKALFDSYDMNKHAHIGAAHTSALSDEFVDACAIVGPASHCAERLQEIVELGIDRLVVLTARSNASHDEVGVAQRALATEVLPKVRSLVSR